MRLFIAIDLPEVIKEALQSVREHTLPVKWSPVGNYHITMFFIGETGEEQAESIRRRLHEVPPGSRLELQVAGLGAFPDTKRPRVIWAGITPKDPITDLHSRIQPVLRQAGAGFDDKPFHPHVTLARTRKRNGQISSFLEDRSEDYFGSFEATHFHLYNSELQQQGAIHHILDSYPIAGD